MKRNNDNEQTGSIVEIGSFRFFLFLILAEQEPTDNFRVKTDTGGEVFLNND